MYSRTDLQLEAREALETVWFVRSLEEIERTDLTLSPRMYIGPEFFVQAFLGERSGSLYFALVERRRRIFGIDREGGEWHLHPFDSPDEHKTSAGGTRTKAAVVVSGEGGRSPTAARATLEHPGSRRRSIGRASSTTSAR